MRVICWAAFALLLAGCANGSDGDHGDAGEDPDSGDDGGTDTDTSTWDDAIDEFWGEAPDAETRLEMFDQLWDTFSDKYACFDSYEVDWDQKRELFRPLVEQAEGYGRFYGLMREMVDTLHDPHSPLLSDIVCKTPRSQRPPMFKNLNVIPIVGGCVTLHDEDELLVLRAAAAADNPLGLAAGDVILGFDGLTWQENLDDIDAWNLPECDEDFAAAPVSAARQRAASLPSNAHLFTTIEVRRYGTDEIESFDTELLLENISDYMVCGDQIPIEGVEQPVESWAQFDYDTCASCVSFGVVPDTNVGFISVYAWYGAALSDFRDAVEALWDTDALIIDQRMNLGGVVQFLDYGFPLLFDEDIDPLVSFHRRDPGSDDHLALEEDYVTWLDADEATFYDHPIAVLTGPKSGSAGDLCPYLLAHHPRARLFGRETSGAFGEVLPVWYPADPFIGDLSAKVTRAQMVSADGEHLNAWAQAPDQPVWFTREDAAAGVDTVFAAAMEWIGEENAK
jgi:C-terminal processing protease CtpA/Prc